MNTEITDTKVEALKVEVPKVEAPKVKTPTVEAAPQPPTIAIIFDPKQPMVFSTRLLNGATEEQLWWAAHWIYLSLKTKHEREWTRELNKQETITDRLKKFGGKFRRK